MQYMMMPLDEHYDMGFGSVADAFHDAAFALQKAQPQPIFFGHLPQSYLFRHAVELFLKSGIVIIHKKLKIPYGAKPHDSMPPEVLVNGKPKSIFAVHSIGALYAEWKSLIDPRLAELQQMCRHGPDWTITPEVDGWIKTIDQIDPNSTYFRYPAGRNSAEDQEKSPFKRIEPEALFPPDAPEERRVVALAIENADGEVTSLFMHEKTADALGPYLAALEEVCKVLFCYHAMMRMELTGGF